MLNWYDDNDDLPDGIHIAKIIAINETTAKSSGNPMWVFKLAFKDSPSTLNVYQVIDGTFNSKFARIAITRRLKEMALCFSVTPPGENTSDWIGHTGYISTIHKTMENGGVFIQAETFYPPKIGKARYEAAKTQCSIPHDDDFGTERTGELPRPDQELLAARKSQQGQSVNKNWAPINPEPFDPDTGF